MVDSSRGRAKPIPAPRGKGRRTQTERERLQQEESLRTRAKDEQLAREREEQRLAAERAERVKQRARGGHAGRGGRGGFMGETRMPSGPFSAGSVITPHRSKTFPRPWAPSKRGRTGQARSQTIKRETGTEGESAAGPQNERHDSEYGGYVSSDGDDAEEGPRTNVDAITISDDEDGGGGSFVPVRIQRIPHQDRAPPVNPEVSTVHIKIQETEDDDGIMDGIPISAVKKGKRRAKVTEPARAERPWKGVYEDKDDLVLIDDDSSEPVQPSTNQPQPVAKTRNENRSRRRRQFKQKPPPFQTEEDRKEWERRERDLMTLVDELGCLQLKTSGDGDTTMADGAATVEVADQKADRVYLFQFPPVVPDLVSVNQMAKSDSSKQINNSVVNQVNISSATPATGGARDPKEEEVVTIKDDPTAEEKPSVFPPRPTHLPKLESGKVGNLRIYSSGKAKLNWGGVSLQLNMGITSHFLQDSVLVRRDPDAMLTTQDASASIQSNTFQGSAYQFGQIRGKFVVTPDWDEVIGDF